MLLEQPYIAWVKVAAFGFVASLDCLHYHCVVL